MHANPHRALAHARAVTGCRAALPTAASRMQRSCIFTAAGAVSTGLGAYGSLQRCVRHRVTSARRTAACNPWKCTEPHPTAGNSRRNRGVESGAVVDVRGPERLPAPALLLLADVQRCEAEAAAAARRDNRIAVVSTCRVDANNYCRPLVL